MADLRRIFSQLFEKIGDYLSDDASHGSAPSSWQSASAKDARALLLAETRALRAHFRDTMKAYDTALGDTLKALDQEKDQELMAKAPFIRAELQAARRALYRSLLARQDKQTLVTELNEWKQHKHLSKDAESFVRHERMEMLESELRSRQVQKDAPLAHERASRLEPEVVQPELPQAAEPTIAKAERHLPLIELWKSLQPSTDDVMESWSSVLKKAHQPMLDPRTSAELIRSFKQAQGTIKRQDRVSGTVRYRLEVFEEIQH